MAELRPGRAAVERLEEAGQVVVALAVDDPLADADQVLRVRRVDVQIRFGKVLRAKRWVGDVLRWKRADVLTRRRSAVAQGRAPVRIALRRRKVARVVDLRRVTAHSLRGRRHAGDAALCVARREGRVRLQALRRGRGRSGYADPRASRNERGGPSSHPHEHSDDIDAERFVSGRPGPNSGPGCYSFALADAQSPPFP